MKFKKIEFIKGKEVFLIENSTLSDAIQKMKDAGFDPINDFKMNICVYYS